jgi:MFS family permease
VIAQKARTDRIVSLLNQGKWDVAIEEYRAGLVPLALVQALGGPGSDRTEASDRALAVAEVEKIAREHGIDVREGRGKGEPTLQESSSRRPWRRRLTILLATLPSGLIVGAPLGAWAGRYSHDAPLALYVFLGSLAGLALISIPLMGLAGLYLHEEANGPVHRNVKIIIGLTVGIPAMAAASGLALGGGLQGFVLLGSLSIFLVLIVLPLIHWAIEPWRGRRIQRMAAVTSEAPVAIAATTLHVPYCSAACEELAAKTLSVAWLMKQSGPCTFCMKPVTYGRGHQTTMFPYRNQKAFLCDNCLPKARAFMAGVKECCLCSKPV